MNGDYKVVNFYDIQINTGEKIMICYRIHLEVSSVNVILVFHWIEVLGIAIWKALSVLAGLFVVDSTSYSFTTDVYVTALYPVL